jgi:twitching motility protein PilT
MDDWIDIRDLLLRLANSSLPFTDIHIEQGAPVVVRMPSGWVRVDTLDGFDHFFPLEIQHEDIARLLDGVEKDWRKFISAGKAVARPIVLTDYRMRCNAYPTCGNTGLAVSVRRLPRRPPNPGDIGLPEYVIKQTGRSKGLILVTGPTGAGKTTTIASLLGHINKTRSAHIITIEKPIEYVIERELSIISQKEVGSDTGSFAEGLEEALQQRPSVLFIGEIRDKASAETTLHAAESGHLVFATMHSSSVSGALSKLVSFFPGEEREAKMVALANNLIYAIGQNLASSPDEKSLLLVAEVLVNSPKLAKLIMDPGGISRIPEMMQMASDDKSSRLMNSILMEMLRAKQITPTEAIRISYDPIPLQDLIMRHMQQAR